MASGIPCRMSLTEPRVDRHGVVATHHEVDAATRGGTLDVGILRRCCRVGAQPIAQEQRELLPGPTIDPHRDARRLTRTGASVRAPRPHRRVRLTAGTVRRFRLVIIDPVDRWEAFHGRGFDECVGSHPRDSRTFLGICSRSSEESAAPNLAPSRASCPRRYSSPLPEPIDRTNRTHDSIDATATVWSG